MTMGLSAAVLLVALLIPQQVPPVNPSAQPSFDEWLSGVRAEALGRGIREVTLDAALTGLEPVPTVIQRDRSQAEIVQTLDRKPEAFARSPQAPGPSAALQPRARVLQLCPDGSEHRALKN